MSSQASERAVADILAQFPSIAERILNPGGSLIFARQEHVLPSGNRSDLLFFCGNELFLIELKIREAKPEDIDQLRGYISTYESEIIPEEYPGNELHPVLLAPSIPKKVGDECRNDGIEPAEYDVEEEVLEPFNSKIFSRFQQHRLSIPSQSVRYLHYINGVLEYISKSNQETISVSELADNYEEIAKGTSSNPRSRTNSLLRLARRFGLVEEATNSLTKRGEQFVEEIDGESQWEITEGQAKVILELLHDRPYSTPATYSIVTYLEAVFALSKNSYPVTRGEIVDWHAELLGNRDKGETQRKNALVWTSNYSEELGLVRKFGRGAAEVHYLLPRAIPLLTSSRINSGLDMTKAFGTGQF